MLPFVCSVIDQEMLNVEGTSGWALCATLFLLPHFDIIFDLLLNRH